MADAGANVQSWFSWEEHFLDFLLFFWISSGLLIVGVVNSLTTFFGPLQPRISWNKPKNGTTSSVTDGSQDQGPESTRWLNSALNWFYLHYNYFPEFVDAWILSLNEQAEKLGGPVQLKFEKVQSGSLPPKFGEVTFDSGPEDKYVVTCRVESRDLSFAVFASQQTHQGVKLTNLVMTILKLRGQLNIRLFRQDKDMMAEVTFLGMPDIKVQGKPVNPYMDPSDLVDVGVVQEVVRHTICLASTTVNVSQWIGRIDTDSMLVHRTLSHESAGPVPSSPRSPSQKQQAPLPPHQQRQPEVFEAREVAQQQQSAFHVPTVATTPSKLPQRSAYKGTVDKRLLIKVIKASGLKQNAGQVDPYCVMHVDHPPQSEATNIVRSTFNPFWDEQFYFDLTRDSGEVRFEVLDKKKAPNDNFLGEAIVYCEDLQRNPSSRQIIPLQGRLGVGEFVSGSITVEFLMSEPDPMGSTPRRMVETAKSMTPGGTLVTTTTTTTHRPQNARYETTIDGSPSYIEKRTFDYNGSNPELGTGQSEVVHINGVESVADTAIRALNERSKLGKKTPTRTSTLIITGVKREPIVPMIKTTESTPVEEEMGRSQAPNNMSSPESPEINHPQQTKERQSFAARIKKRFSRSKKRSHSADRASSSLREGSNYLQPPGPQSKGQRSLSLRDDTPSMSSDKDDIDLHRQNRDQPNLKKSRSLGGSLKKLFRRSRKRSRSQGRGEQSRESSLSRHSRHTGSQNPSREGSLTRSSYNPSQQDTVIL